MKSEIHPQYYPNAKVTCACGNSFTVGSTQEKIEIEICAACHPFYTGQEKVLDIAGRVEKFKAKQQSAAKAKAEKSAAKKQKTLKNEKVKAKVGVAKKPKAKKTKTINATKTTKKTKTTN